MLASADTLSPRKQPKQLNVPEDADGARSSAEPSVEAELPLQSELLAPAKLDAIVIDKGLGFTGVMDLLQRLTANSHPTPVVVWGAAVSEAEALRLLQAGARGILRRTSESGTLADLASAP